MMYVPAIIFCVFAAIQEKQQEEKEEQRCIREKDSVAKHPMGSAEWERGGVEPRAIVCECSCVLFVGGVNTSFHERNR
jgi:hypothetical protein